MIELTFPRMMNVNGVKLVVVRIGTRSVSCQENISPQRAILQHKLMTQKVSIQEGRRDLKTQHTSGNFIS